jgi:hypothetical protein
MQQCRLVYGLGTSGNQWAIQNVDNGAMPVGAAFNVMVGSKASNGGKAALLTGTSANTSGTDTFRQQLGDEREPERSGV